MKKIISGGKLIKKIKSSNLVRIFNFKKEIKTLNENIEELTREKQLLINQINQIKTEKDKYKNKSKIIPTLEEQLEKYKVSLNESDLKKKELEDKCLELNNDLFFKEQELVRVNIQKEEYELEIKDLKSDRYLIRKIPAGRTKSTLKTKIKNDAKESRAIKYVKENL